MEYEQFARQTRMALGLEQADYVLKNARVVNVFSGEILKADVALSGDTIVGVGEYSGTVEEDLREQYVCPGFIDSHLHFESTLVAPSELVANAVAFGTTTYIADPHESANVCGLDGIEYILRDTERSPANVYVMMPSCVPSAPFEENGFHLSADQMAAYAQHPRILGLGEVMDYRSVVTAERVMFDKLELFRHKKLDGHAPFLREKEIAAYTLAGISTDHECCDFDYALRERRNGMQILIREGTAAKNLEAIVSGIVSRGMDTTGFCFCTDDKHIEEIRREGHISHCIKKAVALGLSPIQAIQMATVNAARCYGLARLGAVAPGYQADLVVLEDLETVAVQRVYYKGRVVSEKNRPAGHQPIPCPNSIRNSVQIAPLTADSLALPVIEGQAFPVIQLLDGQIVTQKRMEPVPCAGGSFCPDAVYNKIAVVERHRATGHVGVGVLKGFSIQNGAIASSVSHDCHNIIVAGDNDADMIAAVQELQRTQGGYAIASGGRVLGSLPLPVMGLMSDAGFETVNATLCAMVQQAHQMGINPNIDPFITLSFAALPVIPELRLTTRGIYDVGSERFLLKQN